VPVEGLHIKMIVQVVVHLLRNPDRSRAVAVIREALLLKADLENRAPNQADS